MTALPEATLPSDWQLMADQRPIVRSEPVNPMDLTVPIWPMSVNGSSRPVSAGHERPVSGVPIFAVAEKSVCDSLCDMHYSEESAGVLA
jgi:hypothetical protein